MKNRKQKAAESGVGAWGTSPPQKKAQSAIKTRKAQ